MLDESFRIRHVGHCGTEQWPRELWFVFEHFLAVFWTQKCWMFACKDMLWKFGSSTANWRSTVWNGVSLISWRSMPETKSLACNDMRALTAKFCRCRTAWCDFQKCRSEDPQPGCFIFLLVWFWFASNPLPVFFLGAPVKGDASNLQQCQQCSIIYFIADNFGVTSSAVTPSPWFFSACLFARFSLLNLGTWMVNISIVFWAYCIWMFLVTWNSGRVKSRVLESWCEVLPIFPSMSWEQILCKL